jgi:hypothetical protein
MTEQLKTENPSIGYLKSLRDNWSDEIPATIIHGPASETEKKQFKVRRIWWQGVIWCLGRLQLRGLLPPEMHDEVAEFIKRYTYGWLALTTSEDIQRANDLITKIIGDK